jgi:hypothetical protein
MRWIGGGVAQLGEHLLCKQGVIGSNPFTSIPLGLSRIWFDTEGVSSQRRFGIRSVQGSPPIGGFSALADDVGRSLVDVVCSFNCESGSGASLGAPFGR